MGMHTQGGNSYISKTTTYTFKNNMLYRANRGFYEV
jgi:hypothetical protein